MRHAEGLEKGIVHGKADVSDGLVEKRSTGEGAVEG